MPASYVRVDAGFESSDTDTTTEGSSDSLDSDRQKSMRSNRFPVSSYGTERPSGRSAERGREERPPFPPHTCTKDRNAVAVPTVTTSVEVERGSLLPGRSLATGAPLDGNATSASIGDGLDAAMRRLQSR